MTAMPGAPVPRRPAPPPAPHAGPARPRRRDDRAHERPHRPAVRARGHHRAAADRVAARRRPAQPREPAQGGRRAGRRSASGPSCCSACRRTRTPSAAAPSTRDGIVQLALADLRGDVGDDVVLIADLCVDEYTDHGHCGVLDEHGDVDNDATLEIYAKAALAQARAGAHVVAPSGMMDGQVGRIRAALDGEGFDGRVDPRLLGEVRVAASTGRSATPSTSRSSAAATARATSRTGATPARRCGRSTPTSPRAPTW